MVSKFIHLHNHTEYSISLGAIKLKKMIKQAKEFEMPAVAMTDCGNMFGALEFSMAATKEGICPIVGVEFLVQFDGFFKEIHWMQDHNRTKNLSKMVLLAQTDEGFNNLIKLASDNFLHKGVAQKDENGNYDHSGVVFPYLTPRINFEWLREKNEGLICLSGGIEGGIGKLLLEDRKRAEELLLKMKDVFGDRLYMEIMRHGISDEIDLESHFLEFAFKHSVPLVATNDCYFLHREDHLAQDVLSCIADNRYVKETDRKTWTEEHYFKSSDEICELFSDLPEALENTINIAKKIRTMAYKRKPSLPRFLLPEGITETDEIRKQCKEGLNERLEQKFINENITSQSEQQKIKEHYFTRLEYEIDIIIKMDFPGYFLIVSDFIKWSKNNDVPIGPGRGSGAGSVVAWSLRITDIDPIRFDISFERFLNPERISMPDFDIDFCERGRSRSIKYVQDKYGKDLVARIITFGKLQARGAVKDVGRVLGMAYQERDRIVSNFEDKKTIEEIVRDDIGLQGQMKEDELLNEVINIAIEVEGLNKNTGLHAAGIVIGDKPLEQICPLYFTDDSDLPVVQYSMKYAEESGLVKFDFLGLSTLTIIRDTLSLLRRRNIKIDIDNIRLDDVPVYKMLAKADTLGVFQIESAGMKSVLVQLQPDRIGDIAALVALYRPGPMGNIPTYIKRKNKAENITCLHPKMLDILKDTYGVIVYQDQVMSLARDLAGYSMGGADLLRRAMGKKIKEEMDKQRDIFVKGGKVKTKILNVETEIDIPGVQKHSGISEEVGGKIFDLMAEFASYGFNLAHATAYGIIGYQTAFLRCHFPVEFCAASMNDNISITDRVGIFVQDLKRHNIKLLLPDINRSSIYFDVEYEGDDENFSKEYNEKKKINIMDVYIEDKDTTFNMLNNYNNFTEQDNKNYAIRYALAGIKGIGKISKLIIEERNKNGDFKDIWNFVERFDTKVVNKKTMEALAKSGALDSIHKNRRQIFDGFETLLNYKTTTNDNITTNQLNFLDTLSIGSKPELPKVKDWEGEEKYQKEFESFGFFISGHPLNALYDELVSKGIVFTNEIDTLEDGDVIHIAGVIMTQMVKSGKKGKFVILTISDINGTIEMSLYKEEVIRNKKELYAEKNHNKIMIICNIQQKVDENGNKSNRVIVSDMEPLKDFLSRVKAGEVKRVEKHKRFFGGNKNFNSGKNKEWEKDADGKWRKVESSYDIKNDPIMQQQNNGYKQNIPNNYNNNMINQPVASNNIIKELIIKVINQSVLSDIKTIIDGVKISGSNTKIILVVGDMKVELGDNYKITAVEIDRIKNINGISII